jgi:hypothetical protein
MYKNLFDLIPIKNKKLKTVLREDGLVNIVRLRDTFIEKIVCAIFKTSDTLTIKLDLYGSFVWNSINCKNTVKEIAEGILAHFGEETELVYERLATYIITLKRNNIIDFKKDSNVL